MQLRQLAQGAAWIQVNEIDCKIIELMDSQWINQLYIPPQEAQQDQMTKQATENVLLMSGYPAPIAPNDEHVTHLQVMDAFVRDAMGRPEGIAPDRLPLLMNHGMAHIQAARSNADYMKQYGVQIAQFASKINATQRQMAQAPAPGVAPGPANAPTSGPTRGAAAAVAPGGSNGGGPTPNIAGLPGVPATAAPAGPIPPGAAVPSALPPTRGRP
jgi:hypothetical protein